MERKKNESNIKLQGLRDSLERIPVLSSKDGPGGQKGEAWIPLVSYHKLENPSCYF